MNGVRASTVTEAYVTRVNLLAFNHNVTNQAICDLRKPYNSIGSCICSQSCIPYNMPVYSGAKKTTTLFRYPRSAV